MNSLKGGDRKPKITRMTGITPKTQQKREKKIKEKYLLTPDIKLNANAKKKGGKEWFN